MKTITIKLRTVLFTALTLAALVIFLPASSAAQMHSNVPANGLIQNTQQQSAPAEAAAKPVRKKSKKQKAEKRELRMTQGSGCMDFLFIGWGK